MKKHQRWQESHSVSSSYDFVCKNHSLILDMALSKDAIKVPRLEVNKKLIAESKRVKIEQGLMKMGGFDYPYVVCTDTSVRLAFDKNIEDDVKTFSTDFGQ